MKRILLAALLAFPLTAFAGENLKINPGLNYGSDSNDGALITGDHMEAGFERGKPAYVFMYGQG